MIEHKKTPLTMIDKHPLRMLVFCNLMNIRKHHIEKHPDITRVADSQD